MSRSRTLILGAAVGYTWAQMEPFARSLHHSGYAGDTLLLIGNLPEANRQQLAALGLQTWRIQPVLDRLSVSLRRKFFSQRLGRLHRAYPQLVEILPLSAVRRRLARAWLGRAFHHVACSRYFFYLSFLTRHAGRYDRVLLTDVRDVLFQADPFADPDPAPLQFFLEHHTATIRSDYGNALWVRRTCGDEAFERIADCRRSCSGVTYGTTAGMLAYLAALSDRLIQATPAIAGHDGFDQGVHNWLVWNQAFPDAAVRENFQGPVLTMHGVPVGEFKFDATGRLINQDGSVIPVIHQYDRHAGLREPLVARCATPAP